MRERLSGSPAFNLGEVVALIGVVWLDGGWRVPRPRKSLVQFDVPTPTDQDCIFISRHPRIWHSCLFISSIFLISCASYSSASLQLQFCLLLPFSLILSCLSNHRWRRLVQAPLPNNAPPRVHFPLTWPASVSFRVRYQIRYSHAHDTASTFTFDVTVSSCLVHLILSYTKTIIMYPSMFNFRSTKKYEYRKSHRLSSRFSVP